LIGLVHSTKSIETVDLVGAEGYAVARAARRNRRRRSVLPPDVSLRAAVICVVAAFAALAGAPAAHAAYSGKNGLLAYEGKATSQLYMRRASGRGATRLVAAGRPRDPAFSPQGRRLAYGTGDGKLWISLLDGSATLPLVTRVAPSRDPTWSPGGDSIAFAGGPQGARDLFSIVADGTGLNQLTFSPDDEYAPSWSSRNRIAYVRRAAGRSRGDIAVIGATGGRSQRLTRGRADDETPAWSPSASRIAFTRNQSLYIMGANGRHLRRVTRLPKPVTAPAWSPDGRYLAFSYGRTGHRGLYAIRTNGRGMKPVPGSRVDARAVDWQPTGADPVIAAAGDIACDPGSQSFQGGAGTDAFCHEAATSNLLLRRDLAGVLVLGDAQYEDAAYSKFLVSFAPTWGRFKSIEHPTVGNHEVRTPDAEGYWDYFDGIGAADGPAGPRYRSYYSFDIGTWHLISLDSECADGVCAAGSPQEQWLQGDLAAHPAACTLAFFHRPLVSSGIAAVNTSVAPLWQDLYNAGADLALAGHDHAYERLAPMNAAAASDPARGLREFVVGTGGKDHQGVALVQPTSELREPVYGVLEVTLHPTGYDWTFVSESGRSLDSGHNDCH
jgi:acid phosphatase type 7